MAGYGLFTRVVIHRGDRIVEYRGRLRLWREAKKEDGYNGYLLRLNRTTAIDALPYKKAYGRFANDAAGLYRTRGLHNNAEYLIYGCQCFIEAIRTIPKGAEIFVGYGQEFWALQRKIEDQRKSAPTVCVPTDRNPKPHRSRPKSKTYLLKTVLCNQSRHQNHQLPSHKTLPKTICSPRVLQPNSIGHSTGSYECN